MKAKQQSNTINIKSKFIFSLFTMFTIIYGYGQNSDFYYTFNNEKIHLTKVTGKKVIEYPNGLINPQNIPIGQKLSEKIYLVAQEQNFEIFGNNPKAIPTYITSEGNEVKYKSEVLLKFKSDVSESEKLTIATSRNMILLKSSLSSQLYSVQGDALQISKSVYETGKVVYCTPNFFVQFESTEYIPNDQYFNQQWYLHNTGQGTNDGKTTTVDADIDAPEAWEITKGSPDVVIAVIDTGVTSNHPDLPNTRQIRLPGSNFSANFDGTFNPDDPSPTVSATLINIAHGDACAGIIGATQDNTIGISGIAPNCKIMPIKVPTKDSYFPQSQTPSIDLFSDAIDFAVQNGADIISNSWGNNISVPNIYPNVVSAIQAAIDDNIVVVFSAGNNANRVIGNSGSWGYVGFPANVEIDDLISVGASDRNNSVANYSPNGVAPNNNILGKNNLELVAPSNTADNGQILGESGNIWTLDNIGADYGYNSWKIESGGLPTVGEQLPSYGTDFTNYTGRMSGTSAAAPQVAAVAALVKSVNPCLNVHQIKGILQQTADKVGPYDYYYDPTRPGQSRELGYGKINAFKAVQLAQEYNSTTLDLVIKDSNDDTGVEPNVATPYMWNSQDIWVRHDADNGWEHQNPYYDINDTTNYINVKVVNSSCVTSLGTEQLKVYWAKAATSLAWPYNWDGSYTETININGQNFSIPMGGLVSSAVTLPMLEAGEETIVQIPWQVPNPQDYDFINPEPWHFCLLARIESINDPMTFIETANLSSNVRNNNNIAWKNISIIIPPDVVNNNDGEISGVIQVGNPYNETKTFFLELVKEDLETGKPIYEEAEVSIKMDDKLFAAWERGGKIAQHLYPTLEEKKKIVKENHVLLDNINFYPKETGTLNLVFNFLTKKLTDKTKYKYHVIQKDALTGEIVGGETYEIRKNSRPVFLADAGGDKLVNKNESIIISAQQLNEPAIYNWYDMQGNLVYQGKDLSVTTAITTKYKLEVIATTDGFKDYNEVEVKLNEDYIENISPNPTVSIATINYKLNQATSAYLMVLGNYGTNNATSNNYILDINSSQTTIDLSNYSNGFYTIALVSNGQIVDAQILVKQ